MVSLIRFRGRTGAWRCNLQGAASTCHRRSHHIRHSSGQRQFAWCARAGEAHGADRKRRGGISGVAATGPGRAEVDAGEREGLTTAERESLRAGLAGRTGFARGAQILKSHSLLAKLRPAGPGRGFRFVEREKMDHPVATSYVGCWASPQRVLRGTRRPPRAAHDKTLSLQSTSYRFTRIAEAPTESEGPRGASSKGMGIRCSRKQVARADATGGLVGVHRRRCGV